MSLIDEMKAYAEREGLPILGTVKSLFLKAS